MKGSRLAVWVWATSLALVTLQAQDPSQLEQLQRQLRELQDRFQQTRIEQQRQIEDLRTQIQALQPTNAPSEPDAPRLPTTPGPESTPTPVNESKAWSPADPLRLGGGTSYVEVSLVGLMAAGGARGAPVETLETGGEDPSRNGFTLQSLETVFTGAVDPYFRAQASLTFSIDGSGESEFDLEEAWARTTSLPWNLQVKAGQFLSEFGRLNSTHPHTWGFVDAPLANSRLLGPEGIANPGLQAAWLMPTTFYSEAFCGIQDSTGEGGYGFLFDHDNDFFLGRPAVRGGVDSFGDLLFTPRYAASFDLSASQTVLLGASGAFGPNASGSDTRTEIYGLDLFWKWKPANHHGGFPFVSWQTEWLMRRYEAGAYSDGVAYSVPAERLVDCGVYSQVQWGFRRGWVAGLRGEHVAPIEVGEYEALYGEDPERQTRWRVSPNLTWYPSEFSKLRLQYNYDHGDALGAAHGIWVQLEFLLGAHAAHRF